MKLDAVTGTTPLCKLLTVAYYSVVGELTSMPSYFLETVN